MKEVRFVPNDILIPEIKKKIDEGKNVTFSVKGYSMRLFLENNRDKVILSPVKETLKVGDVVLAEVAPKFYVLHRIIQIEGDAVTLMGDGNVVGTESCQTKDVIGIVTGFYRKGRTQPDLVTGKKWRVYSKIWLTLKPLRRIILGIYRRQPFRI